MAPPSVVSEMVKAFIKAPKAMTSSIEASYRVGGNDKTSLIPGGKDRGLPRDVGGHESFPSSPKLGDSDSLNCSLPCGQL
ncbi:hypothetical protein CDAR_542671 [Caerostris darwini]|uniref:Uncharacterized protein n=1 Tax=Caerostris darwini TaxID=1538125 RepID=A0AAV4VIV0_9ARAC|nr:hypothetical protein CDAR_542671 [Caerostris darwini]